MNETFGTRLARLRKEKGMTQGELAEKLNLSPQAISKWENDQSSPDIQSLLALSEIFGISVDELLGKQKEETTRFEQRKKKKDIDKMFLRIRIDDAEDGDKVQLNLPLALVRAFMNKETGEVSMVSGNAALRGIDFRKVIELVENGVVGEIVTIDSGDGDKIHIFVE